jgi:hypothetical protein
VSELPFLERALADAARRRYGRPWWRPAVPLAARRVAAGLAVAATVAAVAAGAVALSRGTDPERADERPATGPAAHWTTTTNADRGLTVSLPRGWRLSSERLTPRLGDPRELLSAGTFPLRFREGPCSHLPIGALRTMGPADGFVTVLERGNDRRSRWSEFPPRPRRFAEGAEPMRDGDVSACLGGGPELVEFWLPFTDAGRHFYAMVVVGADAPDRVRAEAFAILDRLRFDPAAQPDWPSSQ